MGQMIALLCFFLRLLASSFKSTSRLEAENAALRHQLIVLRRKAGGRAELMNADRLFFILLYRWYASILKAITIIGPEALVRWIVQVFVATALEVSESRRPAGNSCRIASIDPAYEH